MKVFNQEICQNLNAASQREWLETNGLGGFASTTIAGLNTRRYHGLLVAATNPPLGRMVLLSKLEEAILIDGRRYELSVNQYPGVVHPQGHHHLKQFQLAPFPVFTYEIEGIELEKSVFMIHGENSTVIQYQIRGRSDKLAELSLEVRPLVAFRDYHSTAHRNDAFDPRLETNGAVVTIKPYQGMTALHFAHNADEVSPAGNWYYNFEYARERERGLDFREDLFNPFVLRYDLLKRAQAALIASLKLHNINRVAEYRQAEIQRREAVIETLPTDNELVRALAAAADQFIVARGDQRTIIAGYHWFGDWGRDTMIALPGLTLVTGRAEEAKSILLAFARHLDQGMLPNRFPEAGEQPEYNTADATLWYFEAIRALLYYTSDYKFVRTKLYDVLTEIINWHVKGTRYGIKMDEDGLLVAGEAGLQLTWMDAKIGDWVVTPRAGKAVEIQALWYNALCVMEQLAQEFKDKEGAHRYKQMAARAKRSFNKLFWNEAAGCLYDVIDREQRDSSIRPNQIIAASLPNTMLSRAKIKQMLAVIEGELLTPYGLRSLSPHHPDYRGRYEGGVLSRDGAYHQGTVWPWLLGPFITAYLKVHGRTKKGRQQAAAWLEAFRAHLEEGGLGQVSEIFDGDAPHYPRGCIAQAWSVAELLRAAVEDVYKLKPAKKKASAVRKSD